MKRARATGSHFFLIQRLSQLQSFYESGAGSEETCVRPHVGAPPGDLSFFRCIWVCLPKCFGDGPEAGEFGWRRTAGGCFGPPKRFTLRIGCCCCWRPLPEKGTIACMGHWRPDKGKHMPLCRLTALGTGTHCDRWTSTYVPRGSLQTSRLC